MIKSVCLYFIFLLPFWSLRLLLLVVIFIFQLSLSSSIFVTYSHLARIIPHQKLKVERILWSDHTLCPFNTLTAGGPHSWTHYLAYWGRRSQSVKNFFKSSPWNFWHVFHFVAGCWVGMFSFCPVVTFLYDAHFCSWTLSKRPISCFSDF